MKTRLLLLFLLMTLVGWSAQGQSCECQTDFLDISTGLDHSTGQYYNPGDPDLYWTVTSDPSGGPTPRPADVVLPQPSWAPGNPQKWISPFNIPPGAGVPSGTYTLETTFCVCETTDLIFSFSTLVDDDVTITLNDNLGAVMQVLQTASGFTSPTNTTTLVTGVTPGSYTIVANLTNVLSAVGLNINGSIVGPGLTLRECCEPVQPDPCGEVVMETITNDCAEPWNYDYSFHIQNNVTNLAVTDVLFLNPTPGFTITPNFQTSLNIPPNGGVSGTLNTVITANPQLTQNTQLCFTVVLLSNGATCCEFEHCITLTPPDDPCDDVSLFVKQVDCCFNVDVTNNYCEDYFIGIRTTALSSGTTFNTLNGGSNWNFTANGAGTQVLWEPINGHVDLGVTDDLQFCLSGPSGVHQVVFEWLALDQDGNEIVVCTETRELACDTGCLSIVEDTIICNDDGTFTFILTVTNLSNMNIATDIYLAPFMGSPILFTPAVISPVSIPPGGSHQVTTTVTNVNNLPAGSQINYQIILLDLNTGWCCHQNDLIFTVPDCEGCDCGTYDDYLADLNAGFTLIGTDCDDLFLVPNAAQDCDLVLWNVLDLSTGISVNGQSNGTTPWTFTVPGPGAYQICMILIRFDDNGDFCFEGQYCEKTGINCDPADCIDLSLIDPSISCPPRNRLDYVCGCDGRTYTNSCVAKYRNGITSWVAGPCAGGGFGGGILLNGNISGGAVLLDFSVEPENTFVEYVIERKIGSEDEWEEIGLIEATGELTYEFFDDAPATGTNEYQVLAITETGLIEFSNTVLVEFENGDLGRSAMENGDSEKARSLDHQIQLQTPPANTTTILVYPNPTNTGQFQVELPFDGFTSWSLRSAQGKIVKGQALKVDKITFNAQVGDLPPGMYLLEVIHQNPENTDRIKIVIQ